MANLAVLTVAAICTATLAQADTFAERWAAPSAVDPVRVAKPRLPNRLAWHGVKSSRNRLCSPFSLGVPSLVAYAVHVAARPLAIIGDENARLRSRLPLTEWSSAMEQASFNQMYRFDQSPSAQAERLRKEARGTPAGVRRDQLLRRARQIEPASSVQERPKSPGLKSPTT